MIQTLINKNNQIPMTCSNSDKMSEMQCFTNTTLKNDNSLTIFFNIDKRQKDKLKSLKIY